MEKKLVCPISPSRDTVCCGNNCKTKFLTSYQTEREMNWRSCREPTCKRWFCGKCSTNKDTFICRACVWKKKQQRKKGRGGDRSKYGKAQPKMTIESETISIITELVPSDNREECHPSRRLDQSK